MAFIKCPNCGREIDNEKERCVHCGCYLSDQDESNELEEEDKSPMFSKFQHVKKKHIFFAAVGILILSTFIYNTVFVRTIESRNHWKHQITLFAKPCSVDGCDEMAHDRLYTGVICKYYCDEHWPEHGQIMFKTTDNDSNRNSSSSSKEADTAKICARGFVESNLKSPSTAKFCRYSEMTATNLDGDTWRVSGYVDAQNSFGATIRQNWTVTLTLTDSGYKDASVRFS